jgi:hypothetical protein
MTFASFHLGMPHETKHFQLLAIPYLLGLFQAKSTQSLMDQVSPSDLMNTTHVTFIITYLEYGLPDPQPRKTTCSFTVLSLPPGVLQRQPGEVGRGTMEGFLTV